MNDTKNNVAIYNDYLKSINDVKRKVRNAQNVKRKALKKHINASEEDVKLIEDKALTNKTIDFNCNDVKIYCFSNGYAIAASLSFLSALTLITKFFAE